MDITYSNTPPQLLIYSIYTQKNYQQAAFKNWEDSHCWARIVIVVIVIVIVVVIVIVIWGHVK